MLTLREELTLHPGPVSPDGSPSWTLHDPVRNRFFRLGWLAFEILVRWDAGTPTEIATRVTEETTLEIGEDEVIELAEFLHGNQLTRTGAPADSDRFSKIAAASHTGWATWLLHHYLFFRVPLVRPDRFLERTAPLVEWAGTRGFAITTALALVCGLFLVHRQWDQFTATLVDTLTLPGMVGYGVALTGVKIIHELAHAYVAKRRGCHVPTMGVAFLVMWPVLYTDVNEAWTLPDRRQRLAIGIAGIAAELTVAAWATLAWAFLPEGPIRQAAFVLASTTWVSSLLINLSPCMRFDGYFLLMDGLNLPNLHGRAFAIARWWLREKLFGLGEPIPEPFPPSTRRWLVAFALFVWIYRLTLFLGIAVLVYHFFAKIVGVFLFAVEIVWFVARPFIEEFAAWNKRRHAILESRRSWYTIGLAGLVLVAALIPWRGTIFAPGLLKSADAVGLFVPVGARLTDVRVSRDRPVVVGEPLFLFEAPDLTDRLASVKARVKTLDYQLQSVSFEPSFLQQSGVVREQLASALAEMSSLRAEATRLIINAPIAGTITDIIPDLKVGDWVSPKDQLALIRPLGILIVDTYVGENDLERLSIGARALFYPEAAARQPLAAHITDIDRSPVRVLVNEELAVLHGGTIPVRGKEAALTPDGSFYRIRLTVDDGFTSAVTLRGTARIEASPESIAARGIRGALAVALREWGM